MFSPFLFSFYTWSLGEIISSYGFLFHCYMDDTRLFLSFRPSDTHGSTQVSSCLADISSWMATHQLKLNPSETQLQDFVIFLETSEGFVHFYSLRCLLIPGYIQTELLPLAYGRLASAGHSTSATGPECSCRTCFQTHFILLHCYTLSTDFL